MTLTHPLAPPIIGTLLLCLSVVVSRRGALWTLWLRVVLQIAFFIALTFVVQDMLGSPLHPRFDAAGGVREFWEQLVEATWWFLAARVAVVLTGLSVAFRDRTRETKLAADLVAAAIYVATLLAILKFAFKVPIGGMLATSGVIAVVLGLALQSTLSDVFSGIALGLERPYRLGDLVWIEGNIEGYVTQINWRSTHVKTEQNDVAIVPNSIMANARVINHSPTPVQGDTISVTLNAAATVEQSIVVLNAAINASLSPVLRPDSSIICSGLHGDGTVYTISFFASSSELLPAMRGEVFTQISRHLRYAEILLGVAGSVVAARVQPPTCEQNAGNVGLIWGYGTDRARSTGEPLLTAVVKTGRRPDS